MHFLVHADMPRVRAVDAGEHASTWSCRSRFRPAAPVLAIVYTVRSMSLLATMEPRRSWSAFAARSSDELLACASLLERDMSIIPLSAGLVAFFGQISAKKWRFYVFSAKIFAMKARLTRRGRFSGCLTQRCLHEGIVRGHRGSSSARGKTWPILTASEMETALTELADHLSLRATAQSLGRRGVFIHPPVCAAGGGVLQPSIRRRCWKRCPSSPTASR